MNEPNLPSHAWRCLEAFRVLLFEIVCKRKTQ